MAPEDRVRREALFRRLVLKGDERAWSELAREPFDALHAYVHHRAGRERELTDEVVQETWMTALRTIARFDPERGSFEAWVRGIAANVLRAARRTRARDAARRAEAVEPLAPPVAEPDEAVARALTELPARYQSVLRARYADGLGVNEIGAARGITAKAAESLLARARAAFRAAFETRDDER